MKTYRFLTLAALFAAAFLMGCASFKPKLDADRAKAVKKVAILSFTVIQQQPKDALGFSKAGEMKHGRMVDGPEFQGMIRSIANEFAAELHQKTGWQVVSLDAMIANPEYAAKVKEKMSGLHRMSLTGNTSMEEVNLAGVLNNATFRGFSQPEKAKLAKALGADAYADVIMYQSIDQGWSVKNLTGDAAFAFTTRSNLMVFDLRTDDPLWRIQNVDGELSENSSTLPEGTPKAQKLASIGLASAKSSIHKLISAYK